MSRFIGGVIGFVTWVSCLFFWTRSLMYTWESRDLFWFLLDLGMPPIGVIHGAYLVWTGTCPILFLNGDVYFRTCGVV